MSFNKENFVRDVVRAQRAAVYQAEESGDEEGLRFVVESEGGVGYVEDYFSRYSESCTYSLERLFLALDDSEKDVAFSKFILVVFHNVSTSDISQNLYDVAYGFKREGQFLSVEPDKPYQLFFSSEKGNSESGNTSTQLDYAWALRNIRVDKAWQISPPSGIKDGQGISIAHLDTGWTHHIDLDAINFDTTRFKDFIDKNGNAEDTLSYRGSRGHGTKTGSVMMSRGGLVHGSTSTSPPGRITGVAREATYISVRCIKKVWFVYGSHIARAIHYSTSQKADVISMSLGGLMLKAMHTAVEYAVEKNVIVVSAAGNNVRQVVYPARYDEAIAVAASNYHDRPWSGSSRGSAVDISAPGEDVWHANPDLKGVDVKQGNGTSYATAHLAGVAALWLSFYGKDILLQRFPKINLQEVFRSVLKQTARNPNGTWDTKKFGEGIINVENLFSLDINNLVDDFSVGDKDSSEQLVVRVFNLLGENISGFQITDFSQFINEFENLCLEDEYFYLFLKSLINQDHRLDLKEFCKEIEGKVSSEFIDKIKV